MAGLWVGEVRALSAGLPCHTAPLPHQCLPLQLACHCGRTRPTLQISAALSAVVQQHLGVQPSRLCESACGFLIDCLTDTVQVHGANRTPAAPPCTGLLQCCTCGPFLFTIFLANICRWLPWCRHQVLRCGAVRCVCLPGGEVALPAAAAGQCLTLRLTSPPWHHIHTCM